MFQLSKMYTYDLTITKEIVITQKLIDDIKNYCDNENYIIDSDTYNPQLKCYYQFIPKSYIEEAIKTANTPHGLYDVNIISVYVYNTDFDPSLLLSHTTSKQKANNMGLTNSQYNQLSKFINFGGCDDDNHNDDPRRYERQSQYDGDYEGTMKVFKTELESIIHSYIYDNRNKYQWKTVKRKIKKRGELI